MLLLFSATACGEKEPTKKPAEPGIYTLSAAYDVAVKNGFDGTLAEFTEAIRGLAIEFSTTDTAIRWRYEGTETWYDLVALSKLVGPKGDQGEKGDTGATGPKGDQGEKGDTGATGPKGDQGEKGDTGAAGPKGGQGEKGDKGDPGATGPKGDQGEKGDPGEKGDTGAAGRGILKVEVIDGILWVTYTDDPDHPVRIGALGEADEGTDGLDFYPLPDGTYGVMYGKTKYLAEIVVPATHKGKAVTQILPYAFESAPNLTSILLPESLTNIGEFAFSRCSKLTSITIPSGVTNIGGRAFDSCSKLQSVTFTEDSLCETLGVCVFCGCESLASVTIPSSVTSIGGSAFEGCAELIDVTIPRGVTGIENRTFHDCSKLQSVTFANGSQCETLGESAFYGCGSLTGITIPSGVTSVGTQAFYNCSKLQNVVFADGSLCEALGESAFYGCESLSNVTIPDSVKCISLSAFEGCTKLVNVTIPNKVTSIGSSAFKGCAKLTSITIPNRVTSIGESAFSGCNSLESIILPFVGGSRKSASDTYQYPFGYIFGTSSYAGGVATGQHYYGSSTLSTGYSTYYIPESLKSVTITGGNILYGAFFNCTSLTSIEISDSVTGIGNNAFSGCTGLTSIEIPDSVTSIGYNAFYGCTGLTNITIPDSVTSIGSSAFYGCTGLTSIAIPNSITSIGPSTFYNTAYYNDSSHWENGMLYIGNYLIEAKNTISGSYTIKSGTKHIAAAVFYDRTGLTSITIPNSITSIGYNAFYGCTGLTSITIGNSITSIGSSAFSKTAYYNDSSHWENGVLYIGKYLIDAKNTISGSYTIKSGTKCIAEWTFSGCTGLTSITIPNSVASIGDRAFKDCTGLTRITVESGNQKYHVAGNCLIETETKTLILGLKNSVIPSDGSVTSIGDAAFYGCTGLTSITIPNSVTSIGDAAFYGCTALKDIYYTGTQSEWKAISKGSSWNDKTGHYTIHYADET